MNQWKDANKQIKKITDSVYNVLCVKKHGDIA
jgi:hypothetical protein